MLKGKTAVTNGKPFGTSAVVLHQNRSMISNKIWATTCNKYCKAINTFIQQGHNNYFLFKLHYNALLNSINQRTLKRKTCHAFHKKY